MSRKTRPYRLPNRSRGVPPGSKAVGRDAITRFPDEAQFRAAPAYFASIRPSWSASNASKRVVGPVNSRCDTSPSRLRSMARNHSGAADRGGIPIADRGWPRLTDAKKFRGNFVLSNRLSTTHPAVFKRSQAPRSSGRRAPRRHPRPGIQKMPSPWFNMVRRACPRATLS